MTGQGPRAEGCQDQDHGQPEVQYLDKAGPAQPRRVGVQPGGAAQHIFPCTDIRYRGTRTHTEVLMSAARGQRTPQPRTKGQTSRLDKTQGPRSPKPAPATLAAAAQPKAPHPRKPKGGGPSKPGPATSRTPSIRSLWKSVKSEREISGN